MREELQPYIADGFVTYTHDGRPHAQIGVFKRCMHNAKHNWMAFLDADEFLILREKCGLTSRR